ncbi:MAG TPA: response regulator [Ignavibacteriaceae bacterium]|nr:response regulator [Ignavibacteriaceae bacterium]
MKISYRILFINFAIVLVIIGSSALAFYSVISTILTNQQSKYLLNSSNDFFYAYQDELENIDQSFFNLNLRESASTIVLAKEDLDFILESKNGINKLIYCTNVFNAPKEITVKSLIRNNPGLIVKKISFGEKLFYYGKMITPALLTSMSKKIKADIAVVSNGIPLLFSNESINNKYFPYLVEAYSSLSKGNDYEIYSKQTDEGDILASLCHTESSYDQESGLKFLIFDSHGEGVEIRSSLKYISIVIGFAGIMLSLILTYLFTAKMRKQITQMARATETIAHENFKSKINVESNDELGKLAEAFNKMLDVLEKNLKAKNEYSEFITLINKNPTLKEAADAALKKIIKTGKFTIGALYCLINDKISLTSSFGLPDGYSLTEEINFFNTLLKDRELIEINFDKNFPTISTGIIKLEIKYLLIQPIVYNNKIIAILELGSIDPPPEEAKEYLAKIQEQLAIGITNAVAFVQMENLVSELKKLNEEYQKQNVQIIHQNERLLKLHNELKDKAGELEIEKQKAEESTKLKSQFLASMSHELRTPMNSILGLTELMLEDSSLKGKNKERLQVVNNSGKRLMNLINDILDLSKIEASKVDLKEEDFLIDDLLNEVQESFTPLVKNKNIDFEIIRNFETKILIHTDRGKVMQVLVNLLGNAIKFTEKGFIKLIVDSEKNSADQKLSLKTSGDLLKFEVIDSGIGISKEHQKIIFEEFRQVDGTNTKRYNGTGLGLAICKRISELLKGTLSVESEYGKGSKFMFRIPFKSVQIKDPKTKLAVNASALRKNIKNPILIIDDDKEVRFTIGQYLNSRGYEVIYAEDGETGIKEAIEKQPFAITLDVMLPKKDGWMVLKELKENSLTKDIPVILISIIGDKKVGYGLGAFEYFVKPISHEQLYSAFEKLENIAKKRIEKIVIVDDDELEFKKFEVAFKETQVKFYYIKESGIALNKISEIQPDLIIVDLLMPNIDGITLSHMIKSQTETKNIPIIISTAKDLSSEEKEALNNIVEEIAVKSKGHPIDVLKIVRDRIKLMEETTENDSPQNGIQFDSEEVMENREELNKESKGSEEELPLKGEEKPAVVLGEVLIVDDDADTLFTLNEMVQACNCRTVLAKNGIECIQLLENSIPDLILLDIMMPVMDGFQTIKKIKESASWMQIPIFAVTAKAMLEDKKIILRHGFDDYISKPVNAGVLAFKIEKLFAKTKPIVK